LATLCAFTVVRMVSLWSGEKLGPSQYKIITQYAISRPPSCTTFCSFTFVCNCMRVIRSVLSIILIASNALTRILLFLPLLLTERRTGEKKYIYYTPRVHKNSHRFKLSYTGNERKITHAPSRRGRSRNSTNVRGEWTISFF